MTRAEKKRIKLIIQNFLVSFNQMCQESGKDFFEENNKRKYLIYKSKYRPYRSGYNHESWDFFAKTKSWLFPKSYPIFKIIKQYNQYTFRGLATKTLGSCTLEEVEVKLKEYIQIYRELSKERLTEVLTGVAQKKVQGIIEHALISFNEMCSETGKNIIEIQKTTGNFEIGYSTYTETKYLVYHARCVEDIWHIEGKFSNWSSSVYPLFKITQNDDTFSFEGLYTQDLKPCTIEELGERIAQYTNICRRLPVDSFNNT